MRKKRKNMKKICLICLVIFAVSLFYGCNIEKDKESERLYREWYDEVLKGFGQDSIQNTVIAANTIAEYRVVYNIALVRYDYYSLQVSENGTGKFTFMRHESEDFDTGEIVLNVIQDISVEETNILLEVIEDNKFFRIPTIHPREENGLDGRTVFAEGFNGSKTHFVKMWEPDEKYPISKIHKAFADFADTIADRT